MLEYFDLVFILPPKKQGVKVKIGIGFTTEI
jgi:hypothetical protein